MYFSSDEIPIDDFKTIPGFSRVEKNVITFDPILSDVFNQDTLALVNNIKDLLKKNNKIDKTPNEYYENFIKCVEEVGGLYSSFVELVLTHIFLTKNRKIWRYDQGNKAISKLSDKTIAKKISPLLSFLYTPNKSTIDTITNDDLFDINNPNLSLHEKIFLNKFD